MTNNDIFKKLRVALMLRDDEIVEILSKVDFKITKSELGAFFRKEDHPNYRECGDQILRNFLNGLVIHLRGSKEAPLLPGDVLTNSLQDSTSKKSPIARKPPKKELKQDITPVKYKNKPSQSKKNKP